MQQMNNKNSKNVYSNKNNQFSTNSEGVSAVVGVILMVAVTVILAAIIAAFFFGMTDNIPAAPGFAGFDVQRITQYPEGADPVQIVSVQTLSISDNIDSIKVLVDGEPILDAAADVSVLTEVGGKVTLDAACVDATSGAEVGIGQFITTEGVNTITITGKTTDGKTVMLYEVEV